MFIDALLNGSPYKAEVGLMGGYERYMYNIYIYIYMNVCIYIVD